MKITIYIDEQREPQAAEWVRQQRNRSRSIARLIEQAAQRDTPLTLGTMRAMVEDVVRAALRDELKTVARLDLAGLDGDLHPDEEDPELVDLLDKMEF